MDLVEFVLQHTERGGCRCGRCLDRGNKRAPRGHTVSTGFFTVSSVKDPDKDEFIRLVQEHPGSFAHVNMFDGGLHDFTEVGGWIGDQGVGMQCMALGHLLGVWRLVATEGHGCVTMPSKV